MIAADLAVRRIGLLATLAGPAPRTGAAMRDLGLVRDAAIAVAGGRVAWVGPDADFDAAVVLRPGAETLDAAGAAVVPGLVDPHTHLAFAGDRDDEIRRRLAGASYQEIAAEGGGIVRTVEATRAASVGELAALVASRLDEMLLCGTTTAEVKSGYGLETGAEIRSLEAIRLAAARHPVDRRADVPRGARGAARAPREPRPLRGHPRRGDDPRGRRARPRRLRRRVLRGGRLHGRGEPAHPARRAGARA